MAKKPLDVEALKHENATRKNIPTAEFESVMRDEEKQAVRVAYERRNRDLDPQLVWRGKDEQDATDLFASAPPLYIQEKVHPKVLIDDLRRETAKRKAEGAPKTLDLFADFNGLDLEAKTEFYQHDQHWSNRMIVGDSLSVMASLAEREGLRGQVQCIYLDPPYGIKFNSNFQWSTTSRDVKDGAKDNLTREPEQVRAFRDTWRDGIHSYLSYLRDRLTVARDLLSESGSIFVQIGDENVHRVRAVMDEVFDDDNFVSQITFKKTGGQSSAAIGNVTDSLLWYSKYRSATKVRSLYVEKIPGDEGATNYTWIEEASGTRRPLTASEKEGRLQPDRGARVMQPYPMFSDGPSARDKPLKWRNAEYKPSVNAHWKTHGVGLTRVDKADRFVAQGKTLRFVNYLDDYRVTPILNIWTDTQISGFGADRVYVVQTLPKVIERCILMCTDPGDLILDPTCGSGTTAYVAEQWGRRWITVDTSRVAVALARSRLMGARYPYYLLVDSVDGQRKEGEVTRTPPNISSTHGDIRLGFVYERVPHITLKSIANNSEIDVIWERAQETLEPLRAALNAALNKSWLEWEIPREAGDPWAAASASLLATAQNDANPMDRRLQALRALNANLKRAYTLATLPSRPYDDWAPAAMEAHKEWWEARIARQKEIDASIAAKAEFEFLYDKPYVDNSRVRVAGPFTVESLSPHRTLAVDWDDELVELLVAGGQWPEAGGRKTPTTNHQPPTTDFAQMILENLRTAGVQQAHKADRITFTSLVGWPGRLICAVGEYSGQGPVVGGRTTPITDHQPPTTLRAGIFIGPEFGTVSRPDLVAAAREAGDAGFDVLVACAFNYDAHSAEFDKLGRVPVLKARMNPDLHMASDLKATGAGNLFVIFGEPDIKVVSGRWLVASGGRMVVCHERIAQFPGLGSLAEINRLGGSDLPSFKRLASGREVWADESGAAGGGLRAGQHSRGSGTPRDEGVSAVSGRGQGLAGGSGNPSDDRGTVGFPAGEHGGGASGASGGNRPDALRPHEIAAIEALIPSDFPLQLTTDHHSQVTVYGVDVFKPQTGKVESEGVDGIALWMLDDDYNEESFFVRHAYFLGANDPYKALKTTLKAEIDEEAWESLHSDTSRPFVKPKSGRIAVKVINHLGDEVMKVFAV